MTVNLDPVVNLTVRSEKIKMLSFDDIRHRPDGKLRNLKPKVGYSREEDVLCRRRSYHRQKCFDRSGQNRVNRGR